MFNELCILNEQPHDGMIEILPDSYAEPARLLVMHLTCWLQFLKDLSPV